MKPKTDNQATFTLSLLKPKNEYNTFFKLLKPLPHSERMLDKLHRYKFWYNGILKTITTTVVMSLTTSKQQKYNKTVVHILNN